MRKYHLIDFFFFFFCLSQMVFPSSSIRSILSFPHCPSHYIPYPSKYLSLSLKSLFNWFSHRTSSISLLILVSLPCIFWFYQTLFGHSCTHHSKCRYIVYLYSRIIYSFSFSTPFLIIPNIVFFWGGMALTRYSYRIIFLFLYSYSRGFYNSKRT